MDTQKVRSLNAHIFRELCQEALIRQTFNVSTRKKQVRITESDASNTELAEWANAGLFGKTTPDAVLNRTFNLYERLWIRIIKELQLYGMPRAKILNGRSIFATCLDEENPSWSYLEAAQYMTMLRMPVSLMIYPDGWMEFYFGNECTYLPKLAIKALLLYSIGKLDDEHDIFEPSDKQLAQAFQEYGRRVLPMIPSCGTVMMGYSSTFLINFNHICSKVMNKNLIPFTMPQNVLGAEEVQLLEMLRNGNFEEINIEMCDGRIERMVGTEISTIDDIRKLLELTEQIQFGEVTVIKQHGQIIRCKQIKSFKV